MSVCHVFICPESYAYYLTLRVQHSTPVMHEKVHYNKTEIFKIGNIHLKHIRGRNDILQSVQLVQTC